MPPARSRFLQLILLLFAVLLATAPVLHNNFINWDDRDQITANPDFNPVTFHRMIQYWRGPYIGSLYPLSYDFFGLQAWISPQPLDPRIFHAVSIVLHAIATILVWLILRLLVQHDWAATAGAALFA